MMPLTIKIPKSERPGPRLRLVKRAMKSALPKDSALNTPQSAGFIAWVPSKGGPPAYHRGRYLAGSGRDDGATGRQPTASHCDEWNPNVGPFSKRKRARLVTLCQAALGQDCKQGKSFHNRKIIFPPLKLRPYSLS
jgi:hypothetical protein